MIQKSYGKINIVLNVLGKTSEGYHELDMVMLPLKLHDSLQITELEYSSDSFVTFVDYALGMHETNLATIALDKFCEKYKVDKHFRVLINKNLPISSGLGGGSSNAAATMLGLNKMLKLNANLDDLAKIGSTFGSDIPFFVYNTPARVRGKGEIIEEIDVYNDYYVLIVKPFEGCSTKKVYEESDNYTLDTFNVDDVVKALETGDDELLEKSIGNSLEKPAITLIPEIQVIKDKLDELGCRIVLMSGSGSSVFALSTDKKVLKKAFKEMDKLHKYQVFFTRILKEKI